MSEEPGQGRVLFVAARPAAIVCRKPSTSTQLGLEPPVLPTWFTLIKVRSS